MCIMDLLVDHEGDVLAEVVGGGAGQSFGLDAQLETKSASEHAVRCVHSPERVDSYRQVGRYYQLSALHVLSNSGRVRPGSYHIEKNEDTL